MESLTQFVLGAAVTGAVMGARTTGLRAVLAGGLVASLPDLDVLIDHGDAIANMTRHRGESHALFWQTLAAPLLGWAIAALLRERHLLPRWCVAVWLALVTHALLDAMTIYGTQLLLPFTDRPFGVGSLFVIDPAYTLPLLVGTAVLAARGARAWRWNVAGLVLSTAYAAWSVAAQQLATAAAAAELARLGVVPRVLVVTPAPLQTLLWRVVAVTDDRFFEGFWSVLDDRPLRFDAFDRGAEDAVRLRGIDAAERLERFAGGCTKVARDGDELRITDLRMGQEPRYVFSFVVANVASDGSIVPVPAPERSGSRIDVARGLAWLWPRMWGADLPPPR
jgi:inner membrane protein